MIHCNLASSPTMCSWMISAVIDKYNQQGSPVYCCTMDLTKAFDMVRWPVLFTELLERDVNPIFLRTLLFVYVNQSCIVQWNGSSSISFEVCNGVRQGAVSSPLLFSIYIDRLFSLLRNSGFGYRLFNVFYGCFGYADDILLLSASRTGLQAMVDMCNKFMRKRGLKFSTNEIASKSKTKCILFSQKKIPSIAPVKLDGNSLPWVSDIKHLGNILEMNNSMKKDVNCKRGQFIGRVNSLSQEFYFADPHSFIKILNLYTVSFPGSCLWDLFSTDCQRIFSSYNVMLRNIFNLHRTTHRYILETLSDVPHLYVQLIARYVTFVNSLLSNDAFEVRFLSNICLSDKTTVIGRSVPMILDACDHHNLTTLTARIVKKKVMYMKIPEHEKWRLGIIQDRRNISNGDIQPCGLTIDQAKCLLDFACTS